MVEASIGEWALARARPSVRALCKKARQAYLALTCLPVVGECEVENV